MRHFYKLAMLYVLLTLTQLNIAFAANSETLTSANGIQYMTGGVGHDEVLAMRPYAKNFSLNLMFSEGQAGQAVTDINVNIYDENAKLIFRVKAAKPLLYVNLPVGTYTILANHQGNKLRHKINMIKNKSIKVILNWKNEDLDARETNE